MSEVVDAILPALQSIQARLTTIERTLGGRSGTLAVHGTKLDDIEISLGYLTGIESQNKFDLHKPRQRIKLAEDRLKTLEPQP